jgi:hypothetical protein
VKYWRRDIGNGAGFINLKADVMGRYVYIINHNGQSVTKATVNFHG